MNVHVQAQIETTCTLDLGGVVIREATRKSVHGLTIWSGTVAGRGVSVITASSEWGVMAEAFGMAVEGERVIASSPRFCEALKARDPEPDDQEPLAATEYARGWNAAMGHMGAFSELNARHLRQQYESIRAFMDSPDSPEEKAKALNAEMKAENDRRCREIRELRAKL